MLTLTESVRKVYAQRKADVLGESNLNDLPAQLVFKRLTVRVFPDGRRIGEYRHQPSGVSIVFPMMFSKEDKK